MGGFCGRRAAAQEVEPLAPEPPAPEPRALRHGRVFQDRAVQALRKRFGKAWAECGERKKERQQRPLVRPEMRWRTMLEHKLFQRHFHDMGMLLKGIKRDRLAEVTGDLPN